MRVLLQLVDRTGAVTPQEIATFQSAVARCAAALSASAEIPESAAFVQRARDLDAFCAEVDVVVGLNVLAGAGKPITGTRLRGLAEAAGFRLGSQGAFVYPDAHGSARFTLENQEQPAFSSESAAQAVDSRGHPPAGRAARGRRRGGVRPDGRHRSQPGRSRSAGRWWTTTGPR